MKEYLLVVLLLKSLVGVSLLLVLRGLNADDAMMPLDRK